MSSDENKMEAGFQRMVEESVKTNFENNGIMASLRCEMHVKVLQMMRGQLGMPKSEPLMGISSSNRSTGRSSDRALIMLINQLVMEFFSWFGYHHTLETFRMETGDQISLRSELEKQLSISPESPDMPLLAQLIMRVWNKSEDRTSPKRVVDLPNPESPKAQPQPQPQSSRKMKDEPEIPPSTSAAVIKQKKLVQHNQTLILNDPLRKPIMVKSAKKEPTRSVNKPDRKACTESSESELDSYYSEDSEDSDAYADIPDRQFYIEELPPEGKYNPGHGEEGPYEEKQNFVENLFQRYQREINLRDDEPSTSRQAYPKGSKGKRKAKSTESENSSQMSVKEALELQLNTSRGKAATSQPQTTRKARGTLWAKSHQDIGGEALLPVTKPQCPETHIGSVDMNSDENSEGADDEEEVSD